MAEIFPLFRYFSVSSVIDKDNSHGDWHEDIFYNGINGKKRKAKPITEKISAISVISAGNNNSARCLRSAICER